jgi:hypothetical protein
MAVARGLDHDKGAFQARLLVPIRLRPAPFLVQIVETWLRDDGLSRRHTVLKGSVLKGS